MSKLLPMPFASAPRRGINSFVAISFIYAAIYLKDWASQWLSGSVAMGLLALGLLVGLTGLIIPHGRDINPQNFDKSRFVVFAYFAGAWILTLAGKGSPNMSSYYVAIPCALIIVNLNPNLFFRIIVFHFGLTLAVQVFEYFTGQFLFIYQASDGTELDESLFGGSMDIFRAKGMFQGPLSAVAFGLWVMFLARGSTFVASLLFLSAFFASGRLGMLTCVVMGGFRYVAQGAKTLSRGVPWIILPVAMVFGLLAISDENQILFIASALDVGNDQNVARTYFWLASIAHYFSYGPIDLILGNQGFILMAEGGTENDFLRLLLDCGFVGFLLYSGAIVNLIVRAVKLKDSEGLLSAALIVVLMNLFPFVQSLSSALLFWVYFFSKMERKQVHQSRQIKSTEIGYTKVMTP